MAVYAYAIETIRARLLAGMVLTIQIARENGASTAYVRGALAAFQHTVLAFGLEWPALVRDAAGELHRGRELDAANTPHILEG